MECVEHCWVDWKDFKGSGSGTTFSWHIELKSTQRQIETHLSKLTDCFLFSHLASDTAGFYDHKSFSKSCMPPKLPTILEYRVSNEP